MLLGAGAAYQRVEPFDLSIEFVADTTLQDQSASRCRYRHLAP